MPVSKKNEGPHLPSPQPPWEDCGEGMGKEGQTYGFFLAPGQMQLFKEVRY